MYSASGLLQIIREGRVTHDIGQAGTRTKYVEDHWMFTQQHPIVSYKRANDGSEGTKRVHNYYIEIIFFNTWLPSIFNWRCVLQKLSYLPRKKIRRARKWR